MWTREFIISAEKEINEFKKLPIIMLEHNNDSVTAKTVFNCSACDRLAAYGMDNKPAIVPSILRCPTCGTTQKIAYLNFNKN